MMAGKTLLSSVTVFMTMLYLNNVDSAATGVRLSEDISHYEPLTYDLEDLQYQHHRAKRSTQPPVTLHFTAFNTNFTINLHRDHKLFHPDIEIEAGGSYLPFDLGRAYVGHLEHKRVDSELPPSVRGLISTTGHFQGTIVKNKDIFIVEKADKYFNHPVDFHSVIYKVSDVAIDKHLPVCGKGHQNTIDLQKKLYHDKIIKSNRDEQNFVPVKRNNDSNWTEEHTHHWSEKYIQYSSSRHRRAVNTRTTCTLYLQADHKYYAHIGSDVEAVIEELSRSVQTANAIYGAIDFDNDGSPDNINFVVKRIKVHTDPDAVGYRLNGNFGVEKFLELHSEENYDPYCLSYIFTHRDFDGGVLGLAWTAGEGQEGGVCHRYTEFSQGKLSLNTGLVTTLNYGKAVSSLVTHLTFAHEIGHNLGAPHDKDGTSCAPGGTTGNYIMYAHAITGVQDNNNKFSTCSIEAMTSVLDTARSGTGCLLEAMSAICGNKVVEEGEECDCGHVTDCVESCCNPQTDTPGGEMPCRLKSTFACSPSAGPCCDDSCQYVTSAAGHVCNSNTSCLQAALCDGSSAACPAPDWLPNKTPCADGLVCINGTCTGSPCLTQDYESCQCSPAVAGNWRDAQLCHVCCVVAGQCRSTYQIADLPNGTNVPGSPCFDYQGYCDVFSRCRQVDPTGTFNTIRKLLSPESLSNIREWLTTHWYVPTLAGLGFIVLMVIFVKVCGKKIPSDKELYERRMRRYGNAHRHPAANTVAPTSYM